MIFVIFSPKWHFFESRGANIFRGAQTQFERLKNIRRLLMICVYGGTYFTPNHMDEESSWTPKKKKSFCLSSFTSPLYFGTFLG